LKLSSKIVDVEAYFIYDNLMELSRVSEEDLIRALKLCTPKDTLSIVLNKLGFIKFNNILPPDKRGQYDPSNLPNLYINLSEKALKTLLDLEKLLIYTKGISLKLYAPHDQRVLIEYVTNRILDFIGKTDIVHINNVIMELVDNAEKANFTNVIESEKLDAPLSQVEFVTKHRKEIAHLCVIRDKWVNISWKFSKEIFKVEVSNNTLLTPEQAKLLREKATADITTIVDGFSEESFEEDKLGAGLGLYFIKFFTDDMKLRDIETIFRIYSTDKATYASLTLFFERF
jgi:hypothetical protein